MEIIKHEKFAISYELKQFIKYYYLYIAGNLKSNKDSIGKRIDIKI